MIVERFVHYKVGVDSIDKDHYEIFLVMDEVISLAKSGYIINAKEKLLKLQEMVTEHFSKEEKFMEAINYKFIDSHKESHTSILRKIRDIIDHIDTHNTMIKDYVNIFENIFFGHIDCQDLQYTEYILENKIDTTNIY